MPKAKFDASFFSLIYFMILRHNYSTQRVRQVHQELWLAAVSAGRRWLHDPKRRQMLVSLALNGCLIVLAGHYRCALISLISPRVNDSFLFYLPQLKRASAIPYIEITPSQILKM